MWASERKREKDGRRGSEKYHRIMNIHADESRDQRWKEGGRVTIEAARAIARGGGGGRSTTGWGSETGPSGCKVVPWRIPSAAIFCTMYFDPLLSGLVPPTHTGSSTAIWSQTRKDGPHTSEAHTADEEDFSLTTR